MATKKKSRNAVAFFDELAGGPLTFGAMLAALRTTEGWSQSGLGERLGVSRQYLCDVEKSRRIVSAAVAAEWARRLGHVEALFVRLALQAEIDAAGIKLRVRVDAA